MTKKQLFTINRQEAELNLKIDAFIAEIKDNQYRFASLIMERLLMQTDFSDIEDIAFELELKYNYKYVKVENLNDEMKLGEFINDLNQSKN